MIPTVSTLVKYDAAQSVRAPILAANPLPALARSSQMPDCQPALRSPRPFTPRDRSLTRHPDPPTADHHHERQARDHEHGNDEGASRVAPWTRAEGRRSPKFGSFRPPPNRHPRPARHRPASRTLTDFPPPPLTDVTTEGHARTHRGRQDGRLPDRGHPQLHPAPALAGSRRHALGPERLPDARHAPGRHQPPGEARRPAAGEAGEGDGHLPRARGALRAVLRRAHPPGDHQLRRARVAPTSRQGRGSHVHRRVPDPVRVVRRVRHA